jgi:small subunit ribosomal protein S7e
MSGLSMSRVQKKKEAAPTALETDIDGVLNELEAGADEALKKLLTPLKINEAKSLDVSGLKVAVVTVPYKQISAYQRLEGTIIPALEKKLMQVVFVVAKRRAFPKTPRKGQPFRAIRPTGRTLKAVNEALLNDVVFPTTIVAKRIHYNLQGKATTHVFVDVLDRTRAEDRLTAFAIAYKSLTGVNALFHVAEH